MSLPSLWSLRAIQEQSQMLTELALRMDELRQCEERRDRALAAFQAAEMELHRAIERRDETLQEIRDQASPWRTRTNA